MCDQAPEIEPVKVLLVDDHPKNLVALEAVLDGLGAHLIRAHSGTEALRQALAHDFAVILLDVQMPDIDGFETAALLRERDRSRLTPIIFVTASSSSDANVIRGYAMGAVDYVTKPYVPEILRSKVSVLLDLARSAAAQRVLNERLKAANRELEAQNLATVRAHAALKSAQSQLVQSARLAALGQMVAGVAHEINNPLAFVINSVAVAQRDVRALADVARRLGHVETLPPERLADLIGSVATACRQIDLERTVTESEETLTRARDGLKRIQRIVEDLREFSHLDREEKTSANLNQGIRSTVQIARAAATRKDVSLVLDLPEIPAVTCNPAKINQVVLNLLTNAIEASAVGGEVTIATRAVNGGEDVEIAITDTGAGIDPAIREKIFDPFFTTRPPGQGMGLGLSISSTIVREHGGEIAFDSIPGRGTRFTVRLPRVPRERGSSVPNA